MAIQAKCSETGLDCGITIKGENERELIDNARRHGRTNHRIGVGEDLKNMGGTFMATSGGSPQYANSPTEDEWLKKVKSVITGA